MSCARSTPYSCTCCFTNLTLTYAPLTKTGIFYPSNEQNASIFITGNYSRIFTVWEVLLGVLVELRKPTVSYIIPM